MPSTIDHENYAQSEQNYSWSHVAIEKKEKESMTRKAIPNTKLALVPLRFCNLLLRSRRQTLH